VSHVIYSWHCTNGCGYGWEAEPPDEAYGISTGPPCPYCQVAEGRTVRLILVESSEGLA
jgi:hypothetical protein